MIWLIAVCTILYLIIAAIILSTMNNNTYVRPSLSEVAATVFLSLIWLVSVPVISLSEYAGV